MRVSHAEVERLCRKLLAALGMAGGIERDGAHAALWLEARGLGGLALLREVLPALERSPPPPTAPAGTPTRTHLDARGQPALTLGAALVDLARARAGEAREHRVVAEHCGAPMFAVAFAAGSATPGCVLRLAWPHDDGERNVLVGEDGAATIYTCTQSEGCAADALVVECRPAPAEVVAARLAARGATLEIGAAELEARFRASLERGIEADDGDWHALSALAAGALVPDSAASHARGAGGGRYDD